MEFLKEAKNNFIQSEIWMLTFGAAFQRANVYKSDLTNEQIAQKGYFKTMTIGFIESVILGQYISGEISDEEHINNIKSISRYSSNFEEIFQNGGINFGVAQKKNSFSVIPGQWNYVFFHRILIDKIKRHTTLYTGLE